ncbi:LuxR family transcriptional regulator [Halodesulfovibrio sp.]|jgi:LuxR family quorum-sensing system transcriptional regulator CciR|uniref:helix-turn-helix transcriptional regulator n=1 Tax=Halodesulfovibrio sp. TaxID=1912772 RepID=UPI0025DDBEB2|nr:LuxR family transcriptional regulator [Halodesulfovibrio sp.]MCT4535865.1 LuxR family transcriptional regulator [Halodesulfovibrio sp.]
MDDQLQSILETIIATDSPERLWAKFVEYARSKGASQIHTWFGKTNEDLLFLSTAPDWWHEYYVSNNIIEYDHVAYHGLTGQGPLLYGRDKDLNNPLLSERAKQLVRMTTSEFQYGSGITMPSFHNNKRIGGINVCFPESVTQLNDVPTNRVLEILLVSCTAHEKLYSLTFQETDPVPLTPRQQECLTWLACGLTSHQIADKIGISYHTVKMHIDSAKERLGATTRTQAVAKALAAGLINI